MTKPFLSEAISSNRKKMGAMGASDKENQYEKARDLVRAKFQNGGEVPNSTPPSTNARDMMEDRSNAKIGDYRNRVRLGRYLGSK